MRKCTMRFRENQTMRKSSDLRSENDKLTRRNKDIRASGSLGGLRLAESFDTALFLLRVQALKSRKLSGGACGWLETALQTSICLS